jgi:hypothetical protein
MPPTGRSMETRIAPRMMLTAEAAVNLCRESGRSIWVRLPIYEGTFHIYPGGRKEFYPDETRGKA